VRTLRLLVGLAIVAVLTALAAPWLRDAVFVVHLVSDARPTALPVPVQGVAARQVRDTWGASRGSDRRHEGIDIFAPRGTPVLSTTRGLVWRIGENALGGTVVWVLGPGGDLHYYAHLDRVADIVWRQRVAPGDVIGFVGNTGNAAGTVPHLHYGIYRRSSGAVNPYPLLAPVRESGQARRRTGDAS
jgi:murein DD-endopeptidase MepM/ murein hydrolase activator NlpD